MSNLKSKGRKILNADKSMANEPVDIDATNPTELMDAINWYDAKNIDVSVYKKWVKQAADKLGIKLSGTIRDKDIYRPFPQLCRMYVNGLDVKVDYLRRRFSEIKTGKEEAKEDKPKISPMERVKRIANEKWLGEVHYIIDCILGGQEVCLKYFEEMKPIYAKGVVDELVKYRDEFIEACETKDPYVKESYNFKNKKEWKEVVKEIDKLIEHFTKIVNMGAKTRKPRKKKEVPLDKQVKLFTYMHSFDGMTSVDPKKIVGASQVIAWNTAYNKLIVLNGKSLVVHRSSVKEFDEETSYEVILRTKEQAIVKQLYKAGVRKVNKLTKDLKCKKSKATGRFNDKIIILGVN